MLEVLFLILGLVVAIAYSQRERKGQLVKRYNGLKQRLAYEEKTLMNAEREQWTLDARKRIAQEIANLRAEIAEIEGS